MKSVNRSPIHVIQHRHRVKSIVIKQLVVYDIDAWSCTSGHRLFGIKLCKYNRLPVGNICHALGYGIFNNGIACSCLVTAHGQHDDTIAIQYVAIQVVCVYAHCLGQIARQRVVQHRFICHWCFGNIHVVHPKKMGRTPSAHIRCHVRNEDMPSVVHLHVVADKAKSLVALFPHLLRKVDCAEQRTCFSIKFNQFRYGSLSAAHVHLTVNNGHTARISCHTARKYSVSSV